MRQLKEAYHSNYGQDLHNEITEKLSHQPAAHDFARFLLGDSVQEKQTMSKLEAQNIVAALSQQQFTAIRRINQPLREGGDPDQQANPDGSVARTRAFVPHTYLPDGCAGRTYIIKQTLKEMGYASQHVTLYSVDEHMKGNLTVKSIHYASDAPLGSEQNVRWRFHTAPIIKVSTAISERETHNEEYVIDLALTERQPRLLKETEWLHHLVSPTTNIEAIDSHQLEDILRAEEQARPGNNTANYPPGRTILFKLNIPLTELPTLAQLERAKIDPNTMAESSEDWFRTYEHRKLSNQTILEPYYQIAKIIRQEYQHGFHAQRFSQRMRSTPGALRHTFPNVFPQLYTSFKAHLASRGQGESVSHYFQPPPFGISSQTLTTITQKRKSPPVSDDE